MSNSTEQKIIDNAIKLIGQEGYQIFHFVN